MFFLRARAVVGPPEVRFAHPVRLPPDTRSQGRCCSATFKLLCIRYLTEIRVMVFTTLKTPKALIVSEIRVARPVFGVTLETIMRVATRTDTVSQT